MNSTKGAHEFTKGKLERHAWGLEGQGFRRFADDQCYCCATLISNWEKPQAPRPGHENLGESELPNEWYGECQVACKDKHTCVDKSES